MTLPFRSASILFSTCLAVLGLLALPGAARAVVLGDEWVLHNQLPSGEELNATAANGTTNAVVVGNHGTLLYSTSGTTWAPVNTSVTADLKDVVFNGSIYVAVGYGGAILWSYDGNNWTVVNPVDAAFTGVVWTGSQFVAAGGTFSLTTGWTGAIFTSPDGAVWTRRSLTGAPYFFGIATSGSVIAAIGNGFAYTSTNGVTWTKRTLPKPTGSTTANVSSIAWVSGQFILTGEVVWTSTNGTTWNIQPSYAFLIGMKLRWTGSEMIATHPLGLYYSSTDGLAWTDRSAGLLFPPLGGGRFGSGLLTLSYGGHIERQVSLGQWVATHSTPVPANALSMAYSGSLYVAVGKNISWSSTDGHTWTEHYLTNIDMADVTWNGSLFIAVGRGAWRSTDGATWTNTITPFATEQESFFTVATLAGKSYACGYNYNTNQVISALTTDGTNWSGANMNAVVLGMATDGSKLVGVGWRLGVITSTDGTTWTPVSGGNTIGEDYMSVVYGGGQFVAVSNVGNIYTSATGTAWVARQSAANALRSVVRTTNEYLAFGAHGTIVRSFDGIYWRYGPNPTSNDFNRPVWTGTRLVVPAASANFFTSDGTAAVQPTISLTGNTATMAETGGTATITVTMSQAWDIPVNVPLTYTGTSSSVSDYTPSAQSVQFQPGQTVKTVTLTAKPDVLDEVDENLTVTALQPTGDVALSASTSHTITLTDDDTAPTFGAAMADQLVNVGAPVTFTAPATGDAPITYQWKKGTAVIGGARAASYTVAKAALTSAGEYFVEAKNVSATVPSSKAKLGVVTVSNQSKVTKINTAVTLTASAAGAVSYRWRNTVTGPLTDGTGIAGAGTPRLTLSSLTTGHTGVYVCDVSLGALTLPSTTVDLGVIDAVPAIPAHADVPTRVADPFDFTAPVTNRPHKWTITNLPTGLVANATTGRITGKPVKDGTWAVKFIATNLYGASQATTINVVVASLPAPSIGTFVALLPRDPVNNQLGGRVEVATQTNGSFTGKVAIATASYSFTGKLSAPLTADPGAQLLVSRGARLPALNVSFSLHSVTGVLSTQVAIGAASHSGTGLPRAAATSARTGAYNAALSPAPGSPGGTPEGHGYVQFTVAATGSFSAAGRLADDTSFTVASQVAADGTIPLFIPAYLDKGSALGNLTLVEDAGSSYANNAITGALTWFKDATGSGRSYPGGIALMTLNADGGRYTVPVAPQVVMGLTGPVNLAFTGANLGLASRVPDNSYTVASLAKVTATATISAGTTLAFDTGKGLFSGKFFLSDTDASVLPTKPLPRTVLYYGALIRQGGLAPVKGLGYFILDQMPTASPKTTSATSPKLSGVVTLTP